ncbi:MAG: DegT/DnrJ/EryC1/StrS family aminotransferase [Nitrospirota bacterium]|nr:DegT/DnrJ/EryC1/StrS family aminotransferase [Nitrospirota bacterium]MDP2383403.1 DegT/DnrJ/EryC1/StrS family aminotransferase [Nitrospirota bacterium]
MTIVAIIIPHSRPAIDEEDLRATAEVLRSGQIAQGPLVERFERDMASFMGVRGGVAVSSGTAALELALRALNVGAGDEVIMPSYVCQAPWLATQRVGAQARLVDIDLNTFNIDPLAACQAVTKKTRAIIVPHLFGLPADLTALEQIGIPLIEDCAQTLGVAEQGRPVGTVGRLTVCSFYATKLLCAGEGGMVLSNVKGDLERVRSLREYDGAPTLDPFSCNVKLTDLQASLALSQLGRFSAFHERRQILAAAYRAALSSKTAVCPTAPPGRAHGYYRYVVRLPHLRTDPDGLMGLIGTLEVQGIHCRKPVFRPLHRYLDQSGFPNSDEADRTALSIPFYPNLADDEVRQILLSLDEVLL